MQNNFDGIWSGWMTMTATGAILLSGALLALCSLCNLCVGCARALRRKAVLATRTERQTR